MLLPRRVREGDRPSASWSNAIIDYLDSLRPTSSSTVIANWTTKGVSYKAAPQAAAGAGLDLSKLSFGYRLKDAETFTINNGYAKYNSLSQVGSITGADVTVTGGTLLVPDLIVARVKIDPSTWSLEAGNVIATALSALPNDTDQFYYFPLYSVCNEENGAQIKWIHQWGNIMITPAYG